MDYSLLVGIHQCKLYPRSAEDDEEGDDEGSEEESDNGRGGATDGVIAEEDEDSAEANGDISSEGRGERVEGCVGGEEGMCGEERVRGVGRRGDVLKGKWSPLGKVIEESLMNMKRNYVNRM